MKLSEWKENGKYFPYKNFKIFYQEHFTTNDNKATILLIHGFPTASWDWEPIWNKLSESFNLITLDMIGFGFSDKPQDFPYSINEQASLIEAFLDYRDIKTYHILCHDYGVTVTQEILARSEDAKSLLAPNNNNMPLVEKPNIESIVFLNGGLFPETHRPRLIQKLLLSPIGFIISRVLNKKKFSKSFSKVFGSNKPNKQKMNEFWELVTYNQGNLLAHKHIRYMKERKIYRDRWVGVLQTTSIPVLVVNGPADPISGIHMVDHYRELISNPHIVVLPDHIGHYPQVEDPQAVLSAYLDFIGSLRIP